MPEDAPLHCILEPPPFPEFWPGSLAIWLLKVEAGFNLRDIASEQDRYNIIVAIFPPAQISDVQPPGPQAYDALRISVLALPKPSHLPPTTRLLRSSQEKRLRLSQPRRMLPILYSRLAVRHLKRFCLRAGVHILVFCQLQFFPMSRLSPRCA